jgi:hypothetical protein
VLSFDLHAALSCPEEPGAAHAAAPAAADEAEGAALTKEQCEALAHAFGLLSSSSSEPE